MTLPTNRRSSHNDAVAVRLDDRELIARIRDGDVDAFESMFRAYWEPLYRFAFRYLRSPDEAEDVVQTIFARIWRLRSGWHVGGQLADYLYLATRNASFDRLRADAAARQWRNRRVDQLRAGELTAPEADLLVHGAEVEAAIERALSELPPKRRQICELRFAQGLSYAEIAARVNVAQKTVETQLARGLRFLRERLRELVQ